MRRFILLCKRQLTQPVFFLLCLLLPASCLFVRNLERHSATSLCIGLYAAEPDELTSACFADLSAGNRRNALSFQIYTDTKAMRNDVANGSLDCAYAFGRAFYAQLLEKNYKKLITCYVSDSSIMEDLSREVVFASLFRILGEDIVVSYAEDADIFAGKQEAIALRKISALYDKYNKGEEVFSLNYQYLDTHTEEPVISSYVAMPVRGLIAVLLFISGLTGGVSYLADREKKLPVCAAHCILIPLLFMGISACITLWLTDEAGNCWHELFALMAYLFLILVFVRLLLLFIKKPALLSASIPVFALGSLIFCPIFINLGAILPFFAIMEKLFVPYYYLLMA